MIEKKDNSFCHRGQIFKNMGLETGYLLETAIPDYSNYNLSSKGNIIISYASGNGNENLVIKNLFEEAGKWSPTLVNKPLLLKSKAKHG
ncbi:MAG: hypothetical protein IPF62_10975 [Bacteroidetes bacterium]|nr:hypothetical protein [Bacteroidota bacterium]